MWIKIRIRVDYRRPLNKIPYEILKEYSSYEESLQSVIELNDELQLERYRLYGIAKWNSPYGINEIVDVYSYIISLEDSGSTGTEIYKYLISLLRNDIIDYINE